MPKETKDIAASVRARLLTPAKSKGASFDLVLNRYVIERLLYRLSMSPHANSLVLKGAALLMTWLDEPHRGTRDLDLLGFGDNAPDRLLQLFREVLDTPVADDGVAFDVGALRIDRIREDVANQSSDGA
jgi:predicted nucleotidyltransferase component of viral defense system